MGKTADLTLAKKRKKDEFYTQLVDIENELKHYKEHFKDKVVLCNCDDPRKSNFFKYFADNFEKLNLRAFDPDDMRAAYEKQNGFCPICKGKFAFEEMRGDHIKPWSKGGKTVPENLQMLCADCNARKSDKF